jgi:hypothetical protein
MISQNQSRGFWWCAAITGVSALVSAGFSLAAVLARSPWEITALYAASRSVAVPLAILVSIALRSMPAIAALAFVMGLIQLFDGFIGIYARDASKTYGPFVLALLTFITLVRLLKTQRAAGEPN